MNTGKRTDLSSVQTFPVSRQCIYNAKVCTLAFPSSTEPACIAPIYTVFGGVARTRWTDRSIQSLPSDWSITLHSDWI